MTSWAPSQHDPGPVRGACPSVHAPFVELDGALVRIRLPGGRLPLAAARRLAAVAVEVGAGPFELTNRANLQLRGIPLEAVPVVRDALVAAGIAPADPGADEQRNVLASPTAGLDAEELIDTRALVTAIADRLVSASSVPSHKFGVLVDGGGAVHVRGRRHDLALGAVCDVDGAMRYEVRFADALPLARRSDETVWVVDPADVMDVVDAAIGGRRAEERLVERQASDLAAAIAPSQPAVGAHAQRETGKVWIGAVPVLGRLDAPTLDQLADLADGELRITPWRGVVFVDVAIDDSASLKTALERLGLICDPDHPANAVVACAGSRGCAAGLADTQADARAIIDRLAAIPVARRPASIHVSGCEKGCARSQPAEFSLVAGPAAGTYDLYRGNPTTVLASQRPDNWGPSTPKAGERFGERVEQGLDRQSALDAVVPGGSKS